MGGAIAVGFRFKNGQVRVQERWTNPIPFKFQQDRFFRGKRKYINQYLVADPEAKDVPLAPLGYGMIFVDFKTNHLLSMNYYTTLDSLDLVYFVEGGQWTDTAYERKVYQTLIDTKRLYLQTYEGKRRDMKLANEVLVTGKLADIQKITTKIFRKEDDNPNQYVKFRVDTRPLTFVDYRKIHWDKNNEWYEELDSESFQEKLKELGLEPDIIAWKEWLDDR